MSIEVRMDKNFNDIKKHMNFEFAPTCKCQICTTNNGKLGSGEESPNIWCQNQLHIKKNYFPCCCRHTCLSNFNLIKDKGECECPRCCVCQLTNTKCDSCIKKNKVYYPCLHIRFKHSPCLFYDELFSKLLDDCDIEPPLPNDIQENTKLSIS